MPRTDPQYELCEALKWARGLVGCGIRVAICTYVTISGQRDKNKMSWKPEGNIQRNFQLEMSSELGLGRWDGLDIIVLNITKDGG